jgi:hypothetical protein
MMEQRLKELSEQLQAPQATDRFSVKALLSFHGAPVDGTRGISASFAGKVAGHFTDLVTLQAASRAGTLSGSGPAPHHKDYDLLLTGMPRGSVGLTFEHIDDERGHLFDMPVREAVSIAQEIIERLAEGDPERVADALEPLHPRVLSAAQAFLGVVATHGATFSMEFEGRKAGFDSTGDVRRALALLASAERQSEVIEQIGFFAGVRVYSRDFDFRLLGGETISGKFAKEFANVEAAHRADAAGDVVTAVLLVRTIGDAKPRYTLVDFRPEPGTQSD